MIVSTASVIFSIEDNVMKIARSKGFKFWQWTSFFFSTAIFFSTAFFLIKMNAEKVDDILRNDDLVSKLVLFGLGLAATGAIAHLCVQSIRSTRSYELKLVGNALYINSDFFCGIDDPKKIGKKKNVGWKGLTKWYNVVLQTEQKKRYLVYFLDEKEAAEVINLFERYLFEPSKSSSVHLL
jgi:hypothetical protein